MKALFHGDANCITGEYQRSVVSSPQRHGAVINEEISSCSGFERMVQIDWYLKARRSTQKEENSLKQNKFM